MKLAIALENGGFSAHFGGSDSFAFYEVEGGVARHIETLPAPPHEPGVLPRWLAQQGAQAVIAGGMGGMAVQMLEGTGIQVVTGQRTHTPDELAAQFAAGAVQTTGETCAGHDHEGHEGHHHHH